MNLNKSRVKFEETSDDAEFLFQDSLESLFGHRQPSQGEPGTYFTYDESVEVSLKPISF